MSTLDTAIDNLVRARKTLESEQGRRARRNARLRVHGAIKSVRLALDADYPRIAKPEPVKVKAAKPERFVLPFSRTWDFQAAKLFAAIASSLGGLRPCTGLEAHAGVTVDIGRSSPHKWAPRFYFNPNWSARQKWTFLCLYFVRNNSQEAGDRAAILDLWTKFWSEPIATTDLRLHARHVEFIERRGARRWAQEESEI